MGQPMPLPPPPPLDVGAATCLARGLAAVEEYTNAPLRLCEHVSGPDCEVFELQEEFELGPPGRRFVIAVRRDDGEPETSVVALYRGGRR